ncbi:MAG: hypothetical protein IJ071_10140 [Ruminococcus sp.]|nr:hypothetical protein [Ruminococcus sp.]
MRKRILAAGAALVLLTGCGAYETGAEPESSDSISEDSVIQPEPVYTLKGTVYDVSGDTVTVRSDEIGRFTASPAELPEDLAVGDRVTVEYTGEILESYPAYIPEALAVYLDSRSQRELQYVTGLSETVSYSFLAPAEWTVADPEIMPENGGVRLIAPDGSGAVEVVCGPLAVCGTGLTIIEDKAGGRDVSYYSYSEGMWEFAAFPGHEELYIVNSAEPSLYGDIGIMLDTLEII